VQDGGVLEIAWTVILAAAKLGHPDAEHREFPS
jgi:hypothetical protein